ncbi:MAG: mechanosensitive ion channel protein MscS [Porticoccaceae bacterium]|nr:MAG: mechanosensitive ion channel protein MscS [Porticoccaceae bacterium]
MDLLKPFEDRLAGWVGSGWILWVEIFLLIFGALLLGYAVNRLLIAAAARASRTRTLWDDAFLEACRRPAVWLVWIVGVNFAAALAARRTDSEWYVHIVTFNRLALIFLLALFLFDLVRRVERNLVDPRYVREPMDPTTVRAVGKLLRAAILITAALIVLQILGYSVSGVLAFGGIGGLAVGFAAKDLLANFFGGLMIYLDRPFAVGDWVRSPDREIEGTVEDIGWRLTRIRTFDKRPLYIPNSVFTQIAVENPSRMTHRRIFETVGVRYDDVAVLPAILEAVRAMLRSHPGIDAEQTLMVNFNRFGPSSLDFFLYCFTRTTVWTEYHAIKEDVLLRVADIIAEHGAEIAYPTTTVHLVAPEPDEAEGRP